MTDEDFWKPEDGVDGVGAEIVRARCAHLTAAELERMKLLGVDARHVGGPPVGILVGEAPPPDVGDRWRDHLPLFPFPVGYSGDRLMRYAEMNAGTFLGVFLRRNLFERCPERWSTFDAKLAAGRVRLEVAAIGGTWRGLLLGGNVAAAFGLQTFFGAPHVETLAEECSIELVAIPHPSGLNHLYNDPKMQKLAGLAVQWAAGLV